MNRNLRIQAKLGLPLVLDDVTQLQVEEVEASGQPGDDASAVGGRDRPLRQLRGVRGSRRGFVHRVKLKQQKQRLETRDSGKQKCTPQVRQPARRGI